MVQTTSQMLELGTVAPSFALPDYDGKQHSVSGDPGRAATVVMFICNHCPYVKHIREELARVGRDYGERAAVYAINSNNSELYPDDSPERMKIEAEQWGYSFPYLIDSDQSIATAYRAACTPDFFVFDAEHKLAYRGQLDGSRPGNDIPADGSDLRAALDALLAGDRPNPDQTPSIGCNIKWKPGNEPPWFG